MILTIQKPPFQVIYIQLSIIYYYIQAMNNYKFYSNNTSLFREIMLSLSIQNLGIESFHKIVDKAEPGDQLGLLLKGLESSKGIRRGCVLVPQGHKHPITDKVKAQV